MDRSDPASPDQAISGTFGRPDEGGPCLCLRRRRHPGTRLLPIRGARNSATSCITSVAGDFVRELLLESRDVNEYAFALGALSHYAADIAGHPAVNQEVAMECPKRAKFGNSVRYAQDKTAHLKTEFGFDTMQVAKNRYASEQYHDFIGFKVSKHISGCARSSTTRCGDRR
jgi:hypothetical protein